MWKLIILSLILETANLAEVTYYEILGVSKQATTQEIRQAYKKLAVKLHPDKNPGAAEQEKFLKITEAYETLKDPDKRHKYDVYGSYPSYTKKYDYRNQAEYNNLYYNGLYHDDPFVDTLSGATFSNYLQDGFHFINFYSPFCPPCQSLVDHWKKIAELYKDIVKVGAVNCKYHNNFCYNSMRIGSYPSLLFYPNGRKGNFVYYRGDRTFEALNQFIMSHLHTHMHIPAVDQMFSSPKPIAYVLGSNRIEDDALVRIGYHLKGLVHLVKVEDDTLRSKLTQNEYTTVVLRHRGSSIEIDSTDEKTILNEIVAGLPEVEVVEPDTLKKIRTQLRTNQGKPWGLYFTTKKHDKDRLLLHKMAVRYPNINFGEIDCDKWDQLCISLQVDTPPAWGVLKSGGAYQRVLRSDDIPTAAEAIRLHSLSASELLRILDGEMGTWVLMVVPHRLSWDHLSSPFTRASLDYNDAKGDISFGIMACTAATDHYCRQLAPEQPLIVVAQRGGRHYYNGRAEQREITEFVDLLLDTQQMDLDEQQMLDIMDSSREHAWLVAFLPANCGRLCDQLLHEWRLVAKKLRALSFVRVGVLDCNHRPGGLCSNVRSPSARLYPIASSHHYTVSLQHLREASYMLEWALGYIDDDVTKLNWHSFSRTVIAEELHPVSNKKPWLVYFHSPRCYRCYEMYADFAIAGIQLHNAVKLGKVNCITERNLCQHEQITSYPSLRLYLGRTTSHSFSSIINIPVRDHASLLREIKPHLRKYDPSLLAGFDENVKQMHVAHDEF